MRCYFNVWRVVLGYRDIIIEITDLINNEKGYSSEILKSYDYKNTSKKDISYIKQVVYKEIENRILIDYIINENISIKFSKIDRLVLEILRMATSEIFFLENKNYAVVNEAVDLAKKYTRYKDFVNAVLRSISTYSLDFNSLDTEIRYSINKDLLDKLYESFNKKTVKKILKSYLNKSDFVIRENSLLSNNLKENLEKKGYELEVHPFIDGSFIVKNPSSITDTDEFKEGKFLIQDGASTLASLVLKPKASDLILDICAAPGSKSCNIQEITKNKSRLICNDISKNKLERIKENANRLGVENISYKNFDARLLQESFIDSFDKILLDGPCSASGVVKKNPEIKLNRAKKDIEDLVVSQREIFDNSYKYLKRGGILVYSTCSILKDENEDNVAYFLDKYDIRLDHIDFYGQKNDYIKLMPFQKGTQGFFIARFIKN